MSCVHFLVVLQIFSFSVSHTVLYILSFLPHTSSFSSVKSLFLLLNYYFSNCHVNQGKLHESGDRQKSTLSQVYSDYNVTLISSACEQSEACSPSVYTVSWASTHSHFLPHMSLFCWCTFTFIYLPHAFYSKYLTNEASNWTADD